MEKSIKKYFAFFVLPTLLTFLALFLVPFLLGVYLSFTDFTTVNDSKWVGFSNYSRVFEDTDFLKASWFTVKYAFVSVISVNLIAFIFAMVLTKGKKGTNLFRTVFFMPNLIGGIVLGYIWQLIFNGILFKYDLTLTFSAKYGFWGLVILTSWQLIGYMMIIYIAGIQGISKDLLEVATIEGASRFQTLRKVTIPLIMPAITICLFLTLSNAFKLFDQNLALTAGAPSKESTMLALDIYNTFYGRTGFEGVAQSKAVVFFVLVALISLVQLVITRRREIEH
ncbi:carbohydrate ABC transporter permease [Cohnella faecalis]|uniref:Sugar ABC transporter permease n=1 Tax=Cohnella faecalis TaxID=2315694 RepID=A0A398CV68_9BACL|nr:sugar ABC transporter permease [Cohnella faecalis]RIE02924.1 sugar ABC transporter permease [Cohnella faecalis]